VIPGVPPDIMAGLLSMGGVAEGNRPAAPELLPLHTWDCCTADKGAVKVLASFTPTVPEAGTRIAIGLIGSMQRTQHLYVGRSPSGGLSTLDGPRQWCLATFHGTGDGVPFFASGGADDTVRIFNGDTLELVHHIRGAPGVQVGSGKRQGMGLPVTTIIVYHHPTDGGAAPRVVSGHTGGRIQVIDSGSGDVLQRIEGFGDWVASLLAFVHRGVDGGQTARLVVGGYSGRLALYDPEAGTLIQEMDKAHGDAVSQLLAFSPTEARGGEQCWVVSCGNDGGVKVWHPEAHGLSLLHVLETHVKGAVRAALFDGIHIATASTKDGTIRLENAETGALIRVLAAAGDALSMTPVHCITSYELSDGRWRLVTGDQRCVIKVWDPDGRGLLRRLVGHSGSVSCLDVFESGDGVYRLASGDGTGFVCVWNLQDHAPPRGYLRAAHKK
jgi:WD40 repeat protein